MAAAQAGHLDVVEALIQAGARFGHKLSTIVVIICFCQIFWARRSADLLILKIASFGRVFCLLRVP